MVCAAVTACASPGGDDRHARALESAPFGRFIATYYLGTELSDEILQRDEAAVDLDVGDGSPDPAVPVDQFSVVWEGTFAFAARDYHFTTLSDDGIRLYVDGERVIDSWTDHAATQDEATVALTAGDHQIRVEYYENGGNAVARLTWDADDGAVTAADFVRSLGLGVNIERSNAYFMGDFASGTDDFTYLRDLGFTHVRLFYPYRPTVNFGQSNGPGIPPTREQFSRILPAIHHANEAGLKVLIDITDVMGFEDFEGDFQAQIDDYVDMASRAIADEGFDPRMVAVGAVNEWEGGDNPSWNAQRMHMLDILRANLPGFVLTTGAANWKYYQQLMQDDFQLAGDDRVLYDFHDYDGGLNDPAYWADLSNQLATWSAAHGNAAYLMGESGPGASYDGTPASFHDAVAAAADQGHPLHPAFWAMTGGSDLRMNIDFTNIHLDASVEQVVH